MASLRGITQLWTAADTAAPLGSSTFAHVGSKPYVVVFIANDSGGPLGFNIEVASKESLSAGMNEIDSSDPNGGLIWHSYYSWSNPAAAILITAADGVPVAFDLSPFAPELIRLSSVEGFGVGDVVASVTASGPN